MKKFFKCLALVAAMIMPLVTNAQLNAYLYSTGIDATQWITLSSNAHDTVCSTGNGDSFRTTVQNIGFTFNLDGTAYTQFSMNSDGCLRLGATVVGTSGYTTPFGSSYANTNAPKIIGIGRDGRMTGASNADIGCYLKWETQGTEGSRVLIAEFKIASYGSPYTISNWQVQLFEGTDQIKIVYGTAPTNYPTSTYQIGISTSATNVAVINAGTHAISYGATNVATLASTHPETGRYYQFVPASCRPTSAPVVSNITTTGADVAWTAGATETEWEVAYAAQPITDFSSASIQTVTTPSYSISGLTPATHYYVYVRAKCSSTDQSAWNSSDFWTACVPVSQYPWNENFDSHTGSTTSATNNLPVCWSYSNTGTSGAGYPIVYASASYAHSGSNSLRFYTYASTSYSDQIALLPEMSSLNTLLITFDARCYSASYTSTSKLAVGVAEGDGTYTWIDTLDIDAITYQNYEVHFDSYTGTGNRIALCGIKPASSYGAVMVDDIQVYPIPNCVRPTALTATATTASTASLAWTENGTAQHWIVFYDTIAFDPFDSEYYDYEMDDALTTPTITLTGLLPNTTYYAHVISVCGETEYSYSSSTTFRTACVAVADLPYTYGFENAAGSGATYAIDACWRKGTSSTTAYPYPYSSAAHTGTKGLYMYGGGAYSYAVLPSFVDNISQLMVSFWSKTTSTSYTGTVQVGVMTDPTDINTFTAVATCTPEGTTWTEHHVGLGTYQGAAGNIAIVCPSGGNSNFAYIDDITVELTPSCPTANDIAVSNISYTSATLSWDYQHGVSDDVPDNFTVVIKEGANVVRSVSGATSPMVVSGLNPGTRYTACVSSYCTSDLGGTDSLSFSTTTLPCVNMATGDTVTLTGTAATPTYNIPVNTYYKYSYTQQLILSSEMTTSASGITGIAFDYAASTPVTAKTNCVVYMANTSLTALTNTSFVPATDLVKVYEGPLAFTQGWNTIQFQTPFISDGRNIVVAIDDNSNAYNGNTYTFNCHSATGKAVYKQSDSENYNPATTTTMNAGSIRNDMKLLTGTCLEYATCVAPNVSIDSITSNSVRVDWVAGLYESSWDVEYRIAGTTSWTTAVSNTSYNHTVINGLDANTDYEVRVGAICTDDEVYAIVSFRTTCEAELLPYTEDFSTWETGSTGSFNSCWHKGSTYSAYYPQINANYNKSLHMYSTSGNYTYAVLPLLDGEINTLQISFEMYKTNSNNNSVQVGVVTDPDDISTFTAVATVHPQSANTWEGFEVNFDTYTGNGRYIAFLSPSAETSYPYIDNIMVDLIPDCARPTNVTFRDITSSTATVAWAGTASSFEIEYGSVGFSHGAGTVVSAGNEDTVVLSGLLSGHQYDVYVRALCLSGDTSHWSFAKRFTTSCGSIDAVPYTENFNNWGTGSGNRPNCWTAISSISGTPYINGTSSNARGGVGYCLFFSGSTSATPGHCYAVLPPTTLQVDSLQLNFWARQYSTSTMYAAAVVVGVMTDPSDNTTFVALDTVMPTVGSGAWEYFEVPLSNYQDTGRYIAISIDRMGTTYNYMYMDDIELDYIPTCLRPDSLTAHDATSTSVDLSWHEVGTADAWAIQYTTANGNYTNASTLIANAIPYTLTGLTSNTEYKYRVRAICGAGDSSRWSIEEYHFTTAQENLATLPYSYDFETATEFENWDRSSNSTAVWLRCAAGQSALGTGTTGVCVSSNSTDATFSNNTSNVTMWRDFDFGSDTAGFLLQFDAAMGGRPEGNYDGLVVLMLDPALPARTSSTSQTTPWGSRTSLQDEVILNIRYTDLDSVNAWEHFSASLDNVAGVKRIAFYWYNQTGTTFAGDMAKVDNISLQRVVCERPSGLTATNITTTSATLSWTGDNAATYLLSWAPVSGTATAVLTTGTSYQLSGIAAGSQYSYTVRKICAVGDTSDVSDACVFYTECAAITNLPWSENFDNVTTATGGNTGTMPLCWSRPHQDVATPESNLPQVYYSTAAGSYSTSGNYSLRMYYRGIVALPEMGHAVDSLMLTFNLRQNVATSGFVVGVLDSITPGCEASFVPVDTLHCSVTSTLQPQVVYFSNYTGSGRYIAFRNITSSATAMFALHYLDDVVVDFMPTCAPVQNVHADPMATTTTSITLDWTDLTNAASYEIAYHNADFVPGGTVGRTTVVSAHPATISGLAPASNYQFYVRPICGVGDTAEWSDVCTAVTGCDIITVNVITPYIQNFNGVTASSWNTAGILPACWDGYSNGTAAQYMPHVVASTGSYVSPDNSNMLSMTSGSSTYGSEKYVRLPEFSGSVNELTLSFWYRNESPNNGQLTVGYFTDADLAGSFVPVQTITNVADVAGSYASVAFTNAPDSAQYIGYKWTASTSYYRVYIDSVVVTSTNADGVCFAPTDLQADVENITAILSWSCDTVVEFSYKTAAASEWSAPVLLSDTSYTLTHLQPETLYDWRLRAVCDTDNLSDFVVDTFRTGLRPCYAPINLHTTTVAGQYATIEWTLEDITVDPLYWIIELSDGTNTTIDTVDFNGYTYTFTGLTPGTTYSVRVQTECSATYFSSWSETLQFTAQACATVSDVQVTNITMTSADVSWTSEGTAFQVSVCEVGQTPETGVITNASTTSATITDLNPNHPFELYVRSVCGENWFGEWSNVVSFSTRNIEFTITVVANDDAMGTVTGGGVYEANTSVTLTATANPGYMFVRWQEDGNTDNPRTIVADANYTFTAIFERNEGIDGVDATATMSIYPNPTSSSATISLAGIEGKVNITIVDMSGRKVVSETIDCAGDCQKTFNVTNLAQGAYFVRIESESVNSVKKLIVK